MRYVVLDFETASCCDLLKSGAWRYSQDFSTFITHIGFKVVTDHIPAPTRVLYGAAVNRIDPELLDLVQDPSVIFCAHNCSFEMSMWRFHMVPLGYPDIPIERWHDTMASAAMHSLPLGLDALGGALELPIRKDMEGHRLMLHMCKPDKDGNWSHHTPEKMQREAEYNVTDVDSQFQVYLATGGLGEGERAIWMTDQRINQRGVLIDVPFVHACIDVLNQVRIPMTKRFQELTGLNPTQREKILNWVNEQGVPLDDMRKGTLDAMLDPEEDIDMGAWETIATAPIPPHVYKVLDLRRSLASSSVAKLERMLRCAGPDGRVRYTMQYHGANTGRWAGRLIQIQNYPRGTFQAHQGLTPEILAEAILSRDLNRIRELWGNDIFAAIISSLRSCIVPDRSKNCVLVVGDYAQVEARNVLSFAGHHDRAMQFDTTDAYAELASMIFKRPITDKKSPERQTGKNALLGCLAADTLVLTKDGWKPIVKVEKEDRLWDGKNWVTHQGLVFKGNQRTLNFSQLRLTPDHLVFIGDRWCRADGLTAQEKSQALAFAKDHGPFGGMPIPKQDFWPSWYASAIAGSSLNTSMYITSIPVDLGVVGVARGQKPIGHIGGFVGMIQSVLTPFIGKGWSAAYTTRNTAVQNQKTPDIRTMADGALSSISQIIGTLWNTLFPFRDGTIPHYKLTELTTTAITSRGTFGSLLLPKITPTGVQREKRKPNLNGYEPVYDLAHAGPENRFTVMTSDGPLIVHNCGFGLGALGFQAKFAPNDTFELAQLAVSTYRAEFAPLVTRFWYGLYQASVDAVWCNDARTYIFAGIEFRKEGDYLTMRLPSGRKIWYHKPRCEKSYNPSTGNEYPAWSFLSYQGKKTRRNFMWYGQLMNNLVQGSAADLIRHALLRCERERLPAVFTAHDEIVLELLDTGDRDAMALQLKQIMEDVPAWARERRFNVKAECGTMERYQK
jgi:hypothetical protein